MAFITCKCSVNFDSVDKFFVHLKEKNHSDNRHFYACNLSNCDRRFGILKSFRQHLLTTHKLHKKECTDPSVSTGFHEHPNISNPLANNSNDSEPNVIDDNYMNMFDDDKNNDVDAHSDYNSQNKNSDLRNVVAFEIFKNLFRENTVGLVKKLHATYNIPRNYIQKLVEDVQGIFNGQAIDFSE